MAFLGVGVVARALHALLLKRRGDLDREHGIRFLVTGVAGRTLGWRANANGLDFSVAAGIRCENIDTWLTQSKADIVFEAITLDPHSGQPALGYLHTVLARGVHAVSANKGPVVFGYRMLDALAEQNRVSYRFESAVMDGTPVFSLARECLPLVDLRSVRGIFTSTSTIVIESLEGGGTFEDGISRAQRLGIAEADPSYDVDGWDSAVKLCAIANVLLDGDIRPNDVLRTGLRSLSPDQAQSARAAGNPYRLVGYVARDSAGKLEARVGPERCAPGDPLCAVSGTTLAIHYETAMFPGGLVVTSRDPDPTTTAYGMLSDFMNIARTARLFNGKQ